MKNIPDRWRDYSPCNWTPIENLRIILFKTPLAQKYNTSSPSDNGIEESERFTPTDLIEQLAERNMKLGMVLDFTFTTRYYDSKEFTDRGIIYKKMMCAGHVIPKQKHIKRFQEEVKNFLESDNTGSLVGVHCTHGVNRTGYMVCRYLIDCCGYEPDKAIEAFNKARGHPLERENYLHDLRTRPAKDGRIDEESEYNDRDIDLRRKLHRIHDSHDGYRMGQHDWSKDRQHGRSWRDDGHRHPAHPERMEAPGRHRYPTRWNNSRNERSEAWDTHDSYPAYSTDWRSHGDIYSQGGSHSGYYDRARLPQETQRGSLYSDRGSWGQGSSRAWTSYGRHQESYSRPRDYRDHNYR